MMMSLRNYQSTIGSQMSLENSRYAIGYESSSYHTEILNIGWYDATSKK